MRPGGKEKVKSKCKTKVPETPGILDLKVIDTRQCGSNSGDWEERERS